MKPLIILCSLVLISITGFTQSQEKQGKDAQSKEAQSNEQKSLQLYYQIANHLVRGDAGSAASSADSLGKLIDLLSNRDAQPFQANIKSEAKKIAETQDLGKQRLLFEALSNDMIKLVKAVRLTDATIYVAHCPMKKASWLSAAKEIENPYYGADMLHCGAITDSIR